MKDNLQIKCSKYISKLDIREKASLLMVIAKIKSGILLMSSIYFRFFQTVLPMLAMIDEHSDNEELRNFVRKKFSSILRTYIRTNDLAKKEQPNAYSLLGECYDINLDPNVKQIETHVVVTLGDINKNLEMLMNDLLDMGQDANIDKWAENGRYSKISDTLNRLSISIFSTYEDISKALFDGESIIEVDEFSRNRSRSTAAFNADVNNINNLIVAIEYSGSNLHYLYTDICKLQYYIETSTINITAPIIMEEGEKSVKELYSDFGKLNDEAIKNDTHRNGFNISFNKPSNEKNKSRHSPLFFDFGERNRNIGNKEDDNTQE